MIFLIFIEQKNRNTNNPCIFFNEKNKPTQEEKTLTHIQKILNCVQRTQFWGGGRTRGNCQMKHSNSSPEAVSHSNQKFAHKDDFISFNNLFRGWRL